MDDVSLRRRSGVSFYSQDLISPLRPGVVAGHATANFSEVSLDAATIRNPTIEDLPNAKEDSTPLRSTRSAFKSVCIVLVCTSSMIMNNANSGPVGIILPTVGKELGIAEYNLQWIISTFALSSGCFLILFGRLADLYGRKKVFLGGYFMMGAFALGVSRVQNEIGLDLLRAIQGIGGAAVIPASLGILAQSFPPSKARSAAFATFAAGAPLGAIFGVVIGGVLLQLTEQTWRSPFYFFTGVCALGVAIGFWAIEPDQPSTEEDRRVDWIGASLVTSGLVLIVFVLSDSPVAPKGWATSYIIALLVVGVIFVGFFLCWQYYLEQRLETQAPRTRWTAPPLMKLSMWKRSNGRFSIIQIIAFIQWISFTIWTYWVLLYYLSYLQLTPIRTMLRILPMTIMGICCNVIVAMVIGRVDVVWLVAIGTLSTACANILFALIKPSLSFWAMGFPSALMIVFGADFVFSSGTLFISKICFPHEQSAAGALFQTMTQIGATFGLSISTIVFNKVLKAQSLRYGVVVNLSGSNAPPEAQLSAYKAAMWTGVAFGFCGTFLSIFLRGVGIVGHRGDAEPPSEPTLDPEHVAKKKAFAIEDELRANNTHRV